MTTLLAEAFSHAGCLECLPLPVDSKSNKKFYSAAVTAASFLDAQRRHQWQKKERERERERERESERDIIFAGGALGSPSLIPGMSRNAIRGPYQSASVGTRPSSPILCRQGAPK